MPTLLTQVPEIPLPPVPPRKRWTREQCAPLEASGVFETEKLELINGELISKMGKNRPHVNASMQMLFWLAEIFGKTFVNTEAPIDVNPSDNPTTEPQPDLIVLNKPYQTFTSGNPQPQDIRLVVEISDTTLNFDRTVKAALYARAGILEYWILDIAGRSLIAHRNPGNGTYHDVTAYSEHEIVSPLSAPATEFKPSQALIS